MPRRIVRPASWVLLSLGAALLAVAVLGFPGASWYLSKGGGVDVSRGDLNFRIPGAGKLTTGPTGFTFGGPSSRIVRVSHVGWMRSIEGSWWFITWNRLDGGPTIPAGPAPPTIMGPVTMLALFVRVRLLPTGILVGAVGALLYFASKPPAKAGRCATCAYDLTGLSPAGLCPECGTARVHAPTPESGQAVPAPS